MPEQYPEIFKIDKHGLKEKFDYLGSYAEKEEAMHTGKFYKSMGYEVLVQLRDNRYYVFGRHK